MSSQSQQPQQQLERLVLNLNGSFSDHPDDSYKVEFLEDIDRATTTATTATRRAITLNLLGCYLDETLTRAIVEFLRSQQQCNNHNDDYSQIDRDKDNNVLAIGPNCSAGPLLEFCLQTAMGMDLFHEIAIQEYEEEEQQLQEQLDEQLEQMQQLQQQGQPQDWSDREEDDDDGDDDGGVEENSLEHRQRQPISSLDWKAFCLRMQFTWRLKKLTLRNMILTWDHVQSLAYGVGNAHLSTLILNGVIMLEQNNGEANSNNVVENNNNNNNQHTSSLSVPNLPFMESLVFRGTIQHLELSNCRLTDFYLSLLFEILSPHPTLQVLNVSQNHCRKQGIRILRDHVFRPTSSLTDNANAATTTSYRSRLHKLDLSHQTSIQNLNDDAIEDDDSDMDGAAGTMELPLQLFFEDRSMSYHYSYPHLRTLNLTGNALTNTNMATVGRLIVERFPCLTELDLRYNDITAEGLRQLAVTAQLHSSSSSNNGHSGTLYSPLCTLSLINNPLLNDDATATALLAVLDAFPRLHKLPCNIAAWGDTPSKQKLFADKIRHLMDMNIAGRILLLLLRQQGLPHSHQSLLLPQQEEQQNVQNEGSNDNVDQPSKHQQQQDDSPPAASTVVPLSLWPIVFARLSKRLVWHIDASRFDCSSSMRLHRFAANGLYYLLRHGPIFVSVQRSMENTTTLSFQQQQQQQRKKRKCSNEKGDAALGGYSGSVNDFMSEKDSNDHNSNANSRLL